MKKINLINFSSNFARLNGLEDEFSGWHLHEGMRFQDRVKWWGDGGLRKTVHEGIDLLYFLDQQKKIRCLQPDSLVPPLMAGEIVSIFPDFIGKSILFRHPICQDRFQLHSILGHVTLLEGIGLGDTFGQSAQPLAYLSEAGNEQKVPGHVHISLFWCGADLASDTIDWSTINKFPTKIILVDPLEII